MERRRREISVSEDDGDDKCRNDCYENQGDRERRSNPPKWRSLQKQHQIGVRQRQRDEPRNCERFRDVHVNTAGLIHVVPEIPPNEKCGGDERKSAHSDSNPANGLDVAFDDGEVAEREYREGRNSERREHDLALGLAEFARHDGVNANQCGDDERDNDSPYRDSTDAFDVSDFAGVLLCAHSHRLQAPARETQVREVVATGRWADW